MKKLFAVIFMLVVFVLGGCATTGTNTGNGVVVVATKVITVATELAYVAELKAYPAYKPQVIAGLTLIKSALNNSMTYDELFVLIAKQFPGDYTVYAVILSGAISGDSKPLFETYLPMLGSYKAGILKKIDRFIFLASI